MSATLELSAKELALLEALMVASPGYLSAEKLLESVWDENAAPFTKTVTVTIGRLRRKLGEPRVIRTLIGVGYRDRGRGGPYGCERTNTGRCAIGSSAPKVPLWLCCKNGEQGWPGSPGI